MVPPPCGPWPAARAQGPAVPPAPGSANRQVSLRAGGWGSGSACHFPLQGASQLWGRDGVHGDQAGLQDALPWACQVGAPAAATPPLDSPHGPLPALPAAAGAQPLAPTWGALALGGAREASVTQAPVGSWSHPAAAPAASSCRELIGASPRTPAPCRPQAEAPEVEST